MNRDRNLRVNELVNDPMLQVSGAAPLVALYGRWPSFHDAVVEPLSR